MAGKTRITVEIGGVTRELFSVEERKGGDLMIYLKSSRSIATSGEAEHEDIAEQRFSVHVSPKSRGHTIKQTLKTSAAKTTTSAFVLPRIASTRTPAGVVLPPRPQFCWPIFMVRPPRLDTGHYDSRPRKADRRVDLTPFDPVRASIVYMVIASSPNVTELPSIRRRTSAAVLQFRAFNLHVLHGYSPIPSLPAGDFLTFATSPQLTGPQQPSGDREPRYSLTLPAVEGSFFHGLGILRDRYGKQFLEAELQDPGLDGAATIMWGMAAFCTAQPAASADEVIRSMEEYHAEIRAISASEGRIGAPMSGRLPDWLEERYRDFKSR
ncbi:hypothetical protein [Sphingomonas sp.]|uniref:hypothetical protein n=1 Tax=Sphingomonas sp. TaxID=28214 RepID=UPI0026061B1E|nr:hypothetical protein [Sphingomonas sp.]MDF2496085.1 hypothetical protein [Sphingomonas sp.]